MGWKNTECCATYRCHPPSLPFTLAAIYPPLHHPPSPPFTSDVTHSSTFYVTHLSTLPVIHSRCHPLTLPSTHPEIHPRRHSPTLLSCHSAMLPSMNTYIYPCCHLLIHPLPSTHSPSDSYPNIIWNYSAFNFPIVYHVHHRTPNFLIGVWRNMTL